MSVRLRYIFVCKNDTQINYRISLRELMVELLSESTAVVERMTDLRCRIDKSKRILGDRRRSPLKLGAGDGGEGTV